MTTTALPEWKILKSAPINSIDDLFDLDIIDWNRLNGVWKYQQQALDAIGRLLIGRTAYSICYCPMYEGFPERDDWPGWKHAGHHEEIGRQFWNALLAKYPKSELTFSDSPDFYGILRTSHEDSHAFWGDIGKVSASAFSMTVRQMYAHDLWISIQGDTQVILEPQEDFINITGQMHLDE